MARRIVLLDWGTAGYGMVARVGQRASFGIGYLTGIELRGIVVLLCQWLLLWAGPGARKAAVALLATSLRWRQVEATSTEVSFGLIRSTLYILAFDANLLNRWVTAAGIRPRACRDPTAFPLQVRHTLRIGGMPRCVDQMIAGVCDLQRPCMLCSCLLDCIPDNVKLPGCLSLRAYEARCHDRGCPPEEVWRRIMHGGLETFLHFRDAYRQLPFRGEDLALYAQLRLPSDL